MAVVSGNLLARRAGARRRSLRLRRLAVRVQVRRRSRLFLWTSIRVALRKIGGTLRRSRSVRARTEAQTLRGFRWADRGILCMTPPVGTMVKLSCPTPMWLTSGDLCPGPNVCNTDRSHGHYETDIAHVGADFYHCAIFSPTILSPIFSVAMLTAA